MAEESNSAISRQKVLAERLAQAYSEEAQNMHAFIKELLTADQGLKVMVYRDNRKTQIKDKVLKMDDKGRLLFSEAYAMKHVLRMGKVEKWPMPQLNDVKIVAFEKIGKKVGSINHLCKGKRIPHFQCQTSPTHWTAARL